MTGRDTADFDTSTGTQSFDKCERKLKIDKLAHGSRRTFYGSPVNFSKTPVKIVPVNDVSSVCRVCVGLCPGAADSPCKCEKIVNVKHNLLGQVKKKVMFSVPARAPLPFSRPLPFFFFLKTLKMYAKTGK